MEQITQQVIEECIRLSGVEPAGRIISCFPETEPEMEEGWKTRFSELVFGDVVRYRRGVGGWSEYVIYGDRCNMGMEGWLVGVIPIPSGPCIFLEVGGFEEGVLEFEYFGPMWPVSDPEF